MLLALTRDVSPAFNQCELTHLARSPIDIAEARRQHSEYKQCLRELGCHVVTLPAGVDMPDSVFVEDTTVVLEDIAVVARPGAASRRSETKAVAEALKRYRHIRFLEEPATLDGGDVLRIEKTLFVGISTRTNEQGAEQLADIASSSGYKVRSIPLKGGLHLKSAVTWLGGKIILVNPAWIDPAQLGKFDVLEIDPNEPFGANALRVADRIVYPVQHPGTMARLKAKGFKIRRLDMSEVLKAEGGVTCGSVIFSS